MILSPAAGLAPTFGGLARALANSGMRLYLFGKPEAHPERRLGVAVACGGSVAAARQKAAEAAHQVERTIVLEPDARAPAT